MLIQGLIPYYKRIKGGIMMPYGYPSPYGFCGYPAPYPAYPVPYAAGSGFWIAVVIVLFILLLLFGGWWWYTRAC
jgi:hypothetical protein